MRKDMMSVSWLEKLLAMTTFFTACEVHPDVIKNECNKFCLDCHDNAYCGSCINSDHEDHRVIQIRRSSYNEVVKTTEIYEHLDILGVQNYIINSSAVVFLNKRARSQPKRTKLIGKNCSVSETLCKICERNLVDTSFFCSLACKFEWIKENGSFTMNAKERKEMEKLLEESIKVSPKEKSRKPVEQNPKRKVEEAGIDGESEEDKEVGEEEEEENDREKTGPPASKRKPNSRRKGKPCRAPLF